MMRVEFSYHLRASGVLLRVTREQAARLMLAAQRSPVRRMARGMSACALPDGTELWVWTRWFGARP